MEDPAFEIADIIHALTTSPPHIQRETLETYFLPNARFDHPLCRVTSRPLILAIYRWYKILSPIIEISVESVAFDEPRRRLYVTSNQIFTLWVFPWIRVPATLVSVLDLECYQRSDGDIIQGRTRSRNSSDFRGSSEEFSEDEELWYVKEQKDLYQFEEWVGFLPVWGILARHTILFGKHLVGYLCAVMAWVFIWVGILCDRKGRQDLRVDDSALGLVHRFERRVMMKMRGNPTFKI
ncbi:hypothetical protein FPQ18DRAFT_2297 [Pyronema domesticum]|uniref:SigF-like NTF2-like domain-containing protein n=1 Tax=Pyronema omphalodes (strain CBS 100304) TaxID=1076935 RepID=U4LM52_PYROM|nr:hypothetical protein FPQ18DRAFT_2297 [Pyronema domesticum]CCX30415.1 Similar to hypothetical protein MYCGRDRAFT_76127 [Mycosphaerella graminicola IPO323]; acc. no. EGP83777 [Pyronema omphalodes CBS 100304]